MTEHASCLPLGLYIHLPWCVRKCPYCDFNSFASNGRLDERRYIDALLRDLSFEVGSLGDRVVDTLFIGGGTPSLFSGDAIAGLLAGVRERIELAGGAEITLEANPGAIDTDHFPIYREAGVNRLSIGVQSLRDEQLRRLGRVHEARDAVRAVEIARCAGFDNINIDLMYGLPGDEPGDSVWDLSRAVALGSEHVSWYQLTIEPETAFGRCPPTLPDDDPIVADHEAGQTVLDQAGFDQYEVSAYARRGRESRHNLNYWRFGDYIGIGAGAHGKTTHGHEVWRKVRAGHPASYMSRAGSAAGVSERKLLSQGDLCCEFMINALRLRRGFEPALFEQRTGLPLTAISGPLGQAVDNGWLTRSPARIMPTEVGYRFLNDLQMLFVDVPSVPFLPFLCCDV